MSRLKTLLNDTFLKTLFKTKQRYRLMNTGAVANFKPKQKALVFLFEYRYRQITTGVVSLFRFKRAPRVSVKSSEYINVGHVSVS